MPSLRSYLSLLVVPWLTHCAGKSADGFDIPSSAASVSRAEAIATAYTYSRLEWQPESRHVKHGKDSRGVLVHTPDATLSSHGFSSGWWQTGRTARGMPYQWGGFDTPRSFLDSLQKGEFAGDISTAQKRRLDDAGTSAEACGIDCSGFISRCWRLPQPYSTRALPSICERLPRWEDLRAGDILLNDRHVLLFVKWSPIGHSLQVYEAGPYPVWRVNAAEIPREYLEVRGYAPWRYRAIRD